MTHAGGVDVDPQTIGGDRPEQHGVGAVVGEGHARSTGSPAASALAAAIRGKKR